MRKKTIQIISMVFLFCMGVWRAESTIITMPLDQVKAGMKGKVKTAFEENKIEESDAEILGVMYNFQPKKNMILAKLKGRIVDQAGIVMGMSGSPVYIDGKLIGAVAYSFPYSKEAIAGITPIGEMLAISEGEQAPKSSYSLPIPIKNCLTLEELFEIHKNVFSSKTAFLGEGQTFVPLRIPLVFSGVSSKIFEKAKPFFSELGFMPVMSGTSAQSRENLITPDLTLHEGDPIGIQLVGGDLDLSAVGTVTYVDGNKVLAFGHPLYNLGAVDYAMTKVKVITVVPSLESSFKLTTSDILVGKFSQDRTSGALGEIGKMPKLIPLNIKRTGPNQETKEFKLKIVNDKILSPFLVNLSVASLLLSEERAYGDLTLELEGDVYLDNGMSVHLEDFYSGNLDNSTTSLSGLVAAVVYLLTNNEFKDLGIHRIDLNIRPTEQARFCYLERVWLDKYEASPGEKIAIKIYLRSLKEESFLQEVEVSAPNLPSGSEFNLIIGDAASMHQIEMSQYKTQDFIPRSLNQLIRLLNNLRKNNRIYFKIIASKPGLFLKGEEMPNLPQTMKSMFSSPRAAGSAPTELNKSTLSEYQMPVPYVFKGMALIPIKIRK